MRRQIAVILVLVVAVFLAATELVWACKFLDSQFSRCSAHCRPVRCCPVDQTCCELTACEPVVCGPASAAKASEETPMPKEAPVAATKVPEAAEPVEKPVEKPSIPVVPVEKPAEQPAAIPGLPAEEPMVKPAESPAAKPEEKLAVPKDEKADKPAEEPAPKAEEKPAEKKSSDDNPFGQINPRGLRSWTDASGRHQIEARFVSIVGDTVRLQKTDGRYVRVLIEKLCEVDRQFVQQIGTLATNW